MFAMIMLLANGSAPVRGLVCAARGAPVQARIGRQQRGRGGLLWCQRTSMAGTRPPSASTRGCGRQRLGFVESDKSSKRRYEDAMGQVCWRFECLLAPLTVFQHSEWRCRACRSQGARFIQHLSVMSGHCSCQQQACTAVEFGKQAP